MQKVNLKRLRYLPKFLVVCVMCGIIFLGGSGKDDDKNGPSGPDCKETVPATLQISFPSISAVPNRQPSYFECSYIPVLGADPLMNFGSTLFSATNQYVCRVTVTADCPDGSIFSETTDWINPASSLKINVPKNLAYSVVVDYYESCTRCNASSTQRRSQFSANKPFNSPVPNISLILRYISTIAC